MTIQFDWLRYVDVADHLLTQQGEEFFRSAISRAYYGVFCIIRDILEKNQGHRFPTDRSVHRQVINSLRSDLRPDVASLGYDIDRLFRERNRADYRTGLQFKQSQGRKSVSLAKSIQSRISILLP